MANIFISGSEISQEISVTINGPPLATSQMFDIPFPTGTNALQTQPETNQQTNSFAPPSTSVDTSSGDLPSASTVLSISPEIQSSTSQTLIPLISSITDGITGTTISNTLHWIPYSTVTSSFAAVGTSISIANPSSSLTTTGSGPTSSSFGPMLSQASPSQSSASALTGQRLNHDFPVRVVIAAIVPCIVLLAFGVVLFCFWRKQKVKRRESQDKLEGTAVWCNQHSVYDNRPTGNGREFRSKSPAAGDKDDQSSPLMLPKRVNQNEDKTVNNDQQSLNRYSENYDNPFVSPTSQISFPESLKTELPAQGSQADEESTGVNRPRFKVSAGSSVETVIHHPLHRDSNPFTDRAATDECLSERNDEHRLFGPIGNNHQLSQKCSNDKIGGHLDGNSDQEESALQSDSVADHLSAITERSHSLRSDRSSHNDSCPSTSIANGKATGTLPAREESDMDLARKVVRALKKEAFEAQKAAAAAEQQAMAMKRSNETTRG